MKKVNKEIMDTDIEKTRKSLSSKEPKEKDYSWTKKNTDLIKQYIRFPFIEWNRINNRIRPR